MLHFLKDYWEVIAGIGAALYFAVKGFFNLMKDVGDLKSDVKEMKQDIKELSKEVHILVGILNKEALKPELLSSK